MALSGNFYWRSGSRIMDTKCSIDALDLKGSEVDVTPWLPLLCGGSHHTFSMKVAGLLGKETCGDEASPIQMCPEC
jgi:hypothetical protein